MVRDLDMDIEVVGCPIVREPDGLAKSSRNTYLSGPERQAALIVSQTIRFGEQLVGDGVTDARELVRKMTEKIETEPLARVDYVEAVDGRTLQPADRVKAPLLVAMAVYIGKTRLIDNFMIE